jgi:hypothetical protein
MAYLRATRAKVRVGGQQFCFSLDRDVKPFRRGWVVESDCQIDIQKVLAGMWCPKELSFHYSVIPEARVKRCRASLRSSSNSGGVADPLALPLSHSSRRRLRSSRRISRLNCQSRIASRTISLVVAYSPASTAALRVMTCSLVRATLTFWISGMSPPMLHSSKICYLVGMKPKKRSCLVALRIIRHECVSVHGVGSNRETVGGTV